VPVDCILLLANNVVGTVRLRPEPLSAGWLIPTPAYAQFLAARLQGLCRRIVNRGFRTEPDSEADLAALSAQLSLMTAQGGHLEPLRLELWDEGWRVGRPPDRPFLLVDFGASAATLELQEPPAGGQDSEYDEGAA
jgi:hypothetical protein